MAAGTENCPCGGFMFSEDVLVPAAFKDDEVLQWPQFHTVQKQPPRALKAKLYILWLLLVFNS